MSPYRSQLRPAELTQRISSQLLSQPLVVRTRHSGTPISSNTNRSALSP